MPSKAVCLEPAAREVEIDGEQRQADGTEGHQTQFDLAPGESLAQQRTCADAHGENCQQKCCDMFVTAQHLLGVVRELGEIHGAVEPEPRDAEHRQPHDAVAVREPKVAPGFGERIPVDLQIRRDRRRFRDASADQIARDRDRDSRRAGVDRPIGFDGDHQAAGNFAEQDRDEGTHFDQPVAADEFVLAQVLRQDRVLDRPE
jgi:hypothetical protein